jgi:ABC-type Zn uptake system ZnuABC Zn-binding protein ZnuA
MIDPRQPVARRPRRPGLILAAISAIVAIVVGACGGGSAAPAGTGGAGVMEVVTTTTILADLVHQVGGPLVHVESLVPKGGEVHTFDPSPSDVRRLAAAKVVFRNGLGLDDWLAALVADAGTKAPVIALGDDLPGVTYITGGMGEGGAPNPHLWLNVAYAARYVDRIAQALTTADPAHGQAYASGAAAYARTLAGLDAETRQRLATIPAADRVVISFHDAFAYFAAAYVLTIDGTIVDSPGQDPSAAQVARLVGVVRDKGVKAIFAEAQFSDALAQTIARETGATVVTGLLTDSTGDPPQDTYVALMRWNVDRVVGVLAAP